MIQHSVSFKATWVLRFLLLISVVLISACDKDEIIKQQTQSEPTEPSLPVREWYPAPKQRQQPPAYAPAQLQPVMAPSAYQGNTVQQPWGTTAQQPVYSTPQFVYQAQSPVNQYQQPQVWASQQPGVTYQQPMDPQYQYQYAPRPWGNITPPKSSQNATRSTDTWPQGGYVAPWSVPQTGGYQSGTAAGQPGQIPGAVYYDYNW
jgi:hypothetical protein